MKTILVSIAFLFALLGNAASQEAGLPSSDKEAICEVIALHAYTWDEGELEDWSELFTEDAVTHVYPPGAEEPSWTSRSRQELLEAGRHYQANNLKDIQSRHHLSATLFLDPEGGPVKTRTTVLVTHRGPSEETPKVVTSGTYEMHWKRVDGKWMISRRDFRFD